MHLAVRADGGPAIGYGHLVRSGAIARTFLDRGHEVTYVTQTPTSVKEVCPAGITVHRLDESGSERFVDWLDTSGLDAVLTDSYEIGTDYQAAIRDAVPALATVLDDTRHTVCTDMLVNGNVYASDLEYEWIGDEPTWCLGTDYLLLRQPFSERTRRTPPWRDPPERGLITMGGSDVRDTTPTVMQAFSDSGLRVDVVVGPGFSNDNRAAIRAVASDLEATVELRNSPETDVLAEIMLQADVAVSSTGTTVYELLATGTPTIGIPQSDNQVTVAEALVERDALRALDVDDPADLTREELQKLLGSPHARQSLREHGRRLIDGRGTERVFELLVDRSG